MMMVRWLAACFLLLAALTSAGCASLPETPQVLEVRVESDDPTIQQAGLDCSASNPRGQWKFHAPGEVSVLPAAAALKLRCTLPGSRGDRTVELVDAEGAQVQAATKGGKIGAVVGGGVGLAGAVLMPPLAPLFILGGTLRGWQIGNIIGAISADTRDGPPRYPTPVVIRLTPR